MAEGQRKLFVIGILCIAFGVFTLASGQSPIDWYLQQIGIDGLQGLHELLTADGSGS